MDARTIDLAKRIYEKHQEVIDFIRQYGSGEEDGPPVLSRVWYEKSLNLFKDRGIPKAYAWAWQTRNPEAEKFNIAGSSPKPAFYELASAYGYN